MEFNQIQDILAFRVIADNITECYKILGIMHSNYTPIPGRFKDYIAIPKINGYQGLHTTVIGPEVERIEIQIRTHEMNEIAETGIAAHYCYKEGMQEKSQRISWLENIIEINKSIKNSSEFMDVVKGDLDVGGVFVFSPKGDVKELCHDATPLDFAYAVHTEVGNSCVGAKVNNCIVPLRHTLKSGDTVDILTSKKQTPSKDWYNIVKSPRAKTKIRQWLMRSEREMCKDAGREILEKGLKTFNTSLKEFKTTDQFKKLLDRFKVGVEEELFILLGSKKYSAKIVIDAISSLSDRRELDHKDKAIDELDTSMQEIHKTIQQKSQRDSAIIVDGMDNVMVRLAKCCGPIPGDPIVGYVTRGRGIAVHTADCFKIDPAISDKDITVEWNPEFNFKHPVEVKVVAQDRPGILSSISNAIASMKINIRSVMAQPFVDEKSSIIFEIEVKDITELVKIIHSIEGLEEVISVERFNS